MKYRDVFDIQGGLIYLMACRTKILRSVKNISKSIMLIVGAMTLTSVAVLGRRTDVGTPTTVNVRSLAASHIGRSIETEREPPIGVTLNAIHFVNFGPRITLPLKSIWPSFDVNTGAARFAADMNGDGVETVDDCAWLSITTTGREKSVDCFARHVIPPSASFLLSSCSNVPPLIWKETGPDALYLCSLADSIGVPAIVALAIVWQETRMNLRPTIRGRHGEIGRFQLGAARWQCRAVQLDPWTYEGNVRCGLRHLRWLYVRQGNWARAVSSYNGRGPMAEAYGKRVDQYVGRLHLLRL